MAAFEPWISCGNADPLTPRTQRLNDSIAREQQRDGLLRHRAMSRNRRSAVLTVQLTIGLSCLWDDTVHGAEHRTVCPQQLEADTFAVRKAPEGWTGLMPSDVRLTNAGMLAGTPAESGYLVPLETKGAKQGRKSTWRQRWVFSPPSPDTWLYCGYGGGAVPLQLFKRP